MKIESVVPVPTIRSRINNWFAFTRKLQFEETVWGWILILPAVIGLILFKIGPVLASLLLSFTKYEIISSPQWIGLANYQHLPQDDLYMKSVSVTLNYSLLFIPLSIIVAYTIGLLMSQNLKGISVWRTMWYMPSLVPTVASAIIWRWALNPEFGPVNFPAEIARASLSRLVDRSRLDYPVVGVDPALGAGQRRPDLSGIHQRRA